MGKYLWLIDAGHGGVRDGVYVTAPAKQVIYEDGFTINEGVVNRSIVGLLRKVLDESEVDYALIYDEIEDLPLSQRILMANKLEEKHGNCIVVSIHCNAGVSIGNSNGCGWEVFTKPGQDKSDVIAQTLCELYREEFKEFLARLDKSDGDLDKEANFAMVGGNDRTPLKTTASVLIENFFMTNRKEAELLCSIMFQQRIANTIGKWIIETDRTRPI